ncbi:hypothetical protein NHQ30_002799 [Ciborinia camelliae]|nr:hypothetical protein NHQ30_002799 [Ciborinia camelliae]
MSPNLTITALQSSPYYTDLQEIQTSYRTSSQAILTTIQAHTSIYRDVVRARNTGEIQKTQEMIDKKVEEMVELHGTKKREWDLGVRRLAEDVGGRLGRMVLEVLGDMDGNGVGIVGSEMNNADIMNLEGLLVEVAKRTDGF